jgi:hypothetical protein
MTASKTGPRRISTTHKLLPKNVIGAISPYPTVVMVTIPHQIDCGIDENCEFTAVSL